MADRRGSSGLSREPTESTDPMFVGQERPIPPPRPSQRALGLVPEIDQSLQEPVFPDRQPVSNQDQADSDNLPDLVHDVTLEDKETFPPTDFTGTPTRRTSDTPQAVTNREGEDAITDTPPPHPQDETPHRPKLRRKSSSLSVKTLTLPKVNCPEKIFLCVDHSEAMFRNKFQTHSANQTSAFKTLTSAIKQFVCTKSFMNKKHQFSLVMLNEDAQLITDFSSNYEELLFMLNDIAESPPQAMTPQETAIDPTFDLSTMFDIIKQQAGLPRMHMKQAAKMPPPFIVRAVFIYGRSDCRPLFQSGQKNFNLLNTSPFFFLDSVYVHEAPTTGNNVEEIFSEICALDARGSSHIHEVGIESNIAALYNIFAKLLAHPLQRPKQGENAILYSLEQE